MIVIILLVLLVSFLIIYIIILQRKNTEIKEDKSKLEGKYKVLEKVYFDDLKVEKVECEEQKNNNTAYLTNCSNICDDIRSNYSALINKYILMIEENNKLLNELKEIRQNYTEFQDNNSILLQQYNELESSFNEQSIQLYIYIYSN